MLSSTSTGAITETIVIVLMILPAIAAVGLRTALLLGDEAIPASDRRCRLIHNAVTSPTTQTIADLAGICAVAFAATGALVLHYIN